MAAALFDISLGAAALDDCYNCIITITITITNTSTAAIAPTPTPPDYYIDSWKTVSSDWHNYSVTCDLQHQDPMVDDTIQQARQLNLYLKGFLQDVYMHQLSRLENLWEGFYWAEEFMGEDSFRGGDQSAREDSVNA
ncbi:hypothetical protein Q3G72_027049 [Acer saccharum]|nr:hypothetical protein Q3G72_027049 [Acer saccharum]